MSEDGMVLGGDTLEFLKLLDSSAEESGGASKEPEVSQGWEEPHGSSGALNVPKVESSPSQGTSTPMSVYPCVIKGGPRRIARADGQNPQLGFAMGQQRVELPSGQALFKERKKPNPFGSFFIALVAIAIVVTTFAAATVYCLGEIQVSEQESLIGTTNYDGALSLTPAKDGGYYTAFLVTSTKTDESAIGELSQVVLYRCDKGVTTAVRAIVPPNLYVAKSSAYSANYYSLEATLANTQNITRVLQAICDSLSLRIYNVVCCDQQEFETLNGYMAGSGDDSIFTTEALYGRVRTNLTEDGLKSFCQSIRSIGFDSIKEFTVPTTELSAGDVVLLQGSSTSYQNALSSALDNRKLDANGYPVGTQYDSNGNPILDEKGNPYGAIYLDENTLYYDENGYLVFYGQHYDSYGYPVGTQYDENGNALLDANGNPQGTVYDEWGNPTYDWLGNIVIQNG